MKTKNQFDAVKKVMSLVIVITIIMGVIPTYGSKSDVYGMSDIAEEETFLSSPFADVEKAPVCQSDNVEDANVTEVKPGTPTFARVTEQIEKTPEFTAMTNYATETNATVELLAINIADDTSKAVVTYRVAGEVDGFVTNFWIDYDVNKLFAVQQYFVQQIATDVVNFRVVVNDEEILNIDINSDHNVIMSDGTEIYYADYMEQLEAEGILSTLGLCEGAMAVLCGAGGGAACYGLCGITAIVNVLGGLGCAIACGLIASVGCYAATCAVCGGC